MERSSTRRGTITKHHWGSDADLAGDLGMRLDPELREKECIARPAPATLPATSQAMRNPSAVVDRSWKFPSSGSTTTCDEKTDDDGAHSPGEVSVMTPRRMSFFDVGGLLETGYGVRTAQARNLLASNSPTPSPPLSRDSTTRPPVRKGSQAFLQDMGGLLSPHEERLNPPPSPTRNFSRPSSSQSPPDRPPTMTTASGLCPSNTRAALAPLSRQKTTQSLQDVGGLLGPR